METIIIISAAFNLLLFACTLYYVRNVKMDASLLAFTQNLAQEKTKLCDSLKKHNRLISEDSAKKSLRLAQTNAALKSAEAKNEAEYKRGYDAGLEDGRAEKLEIEGGLPVDEAETDEC